MGKQAKLRRQRRERAEAARFLDSGRLVGDARTRRVLQAYVEAAREVLPQEFRPDSCLNATRVCIEALKYHGVEARPLVVDMIVANAIADRMFDEHDGWPKTDEDVQRWMDLGSWVLQIDGKGIDGTPGWPHHLIAHVGDYLVDSSLGQASRPAKGIELPWVCAFPRGPFLVEQDSVTYDAPGGVKIGLRARPDVTSFMFQSGFQPHVGNMQVATKVAARMSLLLAVP